MLPDNRIPTHPGEILLEEFLRPLGLTQVALARHIGVSIQRVNEIVSGKRGVTPDTAWLFASAFGTSPEFWVNAGFRIAVDDDRYPVVRRELA